jgi:hypothetical protein
VSDSDITEMAERLKTEMGGWIFHTPVDFSKKTPSIRLETKQPAVMDKIKYE